MNANISPSSAAVSSSRTVTTDGSLLVERSRRRSVMPRFLCPISRTAIVHDVASSTKARRQDDVADDRALDRVRLEDAG